MDTVSTDGTLRRRRTRDETRELLLEAAMRLIAARIAGDGEAQINPLADVLLTEVLAEANQALKAEDPAARKMTTGAAYNIWPAQTDFRMDLLARVLDTAANPGIDRVRAATLNALARQLPWQDVLAATIETDFLEALDEPAVFLVIGVAALGRPEELVARDEQSRERYVSETGELLGAIMRYAGRRLRPGRSLESLVWAIEALEAGYLLRMRTNGDIPLRKADDGVSALATAAIGIVEAFTEPDSETGAPGHDSGT